MGLKMRIKLRPSRQVPPLPLSLLFPQVFLFGDMIRDERRINDETVTIPGNSDGSSEASFRDSSGRAQEYERILTDSVNICRRAKRRLSSKDVSGRNNRKIRESFTNKYVEIVLNFLVLTKKNEILLDVQPLSQRKSKRSDEGKNVTEKIHTCRVKIELQAAAKFWCSKFLRSGPTLAMEKPGAEQFTEPQTRYFVPRNGSNYLASWTGGK